MKFDQKAFDEYLDGLGLRGKTFTPETLSKMTTQELLSLRMIGLSDKEELDMMSESEKNFIDRMHSQTPCQLTAVEEKRAEKVREEIEEYMKEMYKAH